MYPAPRSYVDLAERSRTDVNPDLRVLVENALGTFEGGRFQEFCLDFLPIYHARFEGLARLGHTAAGKTRAGTPDLLVTAGERQIAVQCGTERDYWPSEKSVAASKPYRDAMDCVKTLTHLAEIVLVTNRETPPNAPNVRAAISAAVNQQTTATVTLLGLEDLGQYLVGNIDEPRIVTLIAHYFPIVGRVLEKIGRASCRERV